jgi:hypothetical protein
MKSLTRVALYALAFSVVPFSYLYAQDPIDLAPDMNSEEEIELDQMLGEEVDIQSLQDEMIEEASDRPPTLQEAKEALDALPGAKDAVQGTVPIAEKDMEVYDSYGRQLAYREGSKKYRESLDKRREAFAKPRTKMIQDYQKTRDIIYTAETADYQKKLNEEKEVNTVSEAPEVPTGDVVSVIQEEAAEEIGLKEQKIPSDTDENAARKKVVTAEDAPDFDPARLNKQPVFVNNVEPPPMPEVVPEDAEDAYEAEKVETAPEGVVPEAVPEEFVEEAVEAEKVETAPEAIVPEAVHEEVEGVVPVEEDAVPEESVVEELDAETEALLNADELDNPFGDDDETAVEEVESPFSETEKLNLND